MKEELQEKKQQGLQQIVIRRQIVENESILEYEDFEVFVDGITEFINTEIGLENIINIQYLNDMTCIIIYKCKLILDCEN